MHCHPGLDPGPHPSTLSSRPPLACHPELDPGPFSNGTEKRTLRDLFEGVQGEHPPASLYVTPRLSPF